MLTDGVSGGTLGLLTGILYDAMIYDIFGLYALIYFLTGAVIGTISDEMLRENQLVYSLAAGLSTIVMHLLLFLILFFLRFRVQFAHGLLLSILVETILNAVLVVFVLRFFIYLSDRFNVKV
ncbi:MAG TPA: rod shape-determining protein MreD, partial [Sedimentibacter sp.]|nr:rod shape-determining protein MreD [Sedimentibacter sp.]